MAITESDTSVDAIDGEETNMEGAEEEKKRTEGVDDEETTEPTDETGEHEAELRCGVSLY